MTNRRIIITEEAENDISNIEEYIAQDNVNAAKEFVIKLKKSFINLSLYPRLGKIVLNFQEIIKFCFYLL